MSELERRFDEDRALRDAARKVLMADIDHARSSISAKGLADRVGTRIGDGAVEAFDVAREKTGRNGGIIAALIGALILWLGREPLLESLGFGQSDGDDLAAPDDGLSPAADPVEQAEIKEAADIASPTTPEPPFTGDDDEH